MGKVAASAGNHNNNRRGGSNTSSNINTTKQRNNNNTTTTTTSSRNSNNSNNTIIGEQGEGEEGIILSFRIFTLFSLGGFCIIISFIFAGPISTFILIRSIILVFCMLLIPLYLNPIPP